MIEPRTFNVYCDESCHLENDGISAMAWGAVYCQESDTRAIADAIRALKARHGLSPSFEAKWTKISPAKVGFYLALVDLFLDDERMRFRGLVVPDKTQLNHAQFEQTHDEWYYKIHSTDVRLPFPSGQDSRLTSTETRSGNCFASCV